MTIMSDIDIAAKYIQEGKLVAFPTETVYGLGANALNPMAVAKIFELKERPTFDPLIVHIANISDLERLIIGHDERVYKLAEKFWPGPLTMVLPKSDLVPDIVTSGLSTVGIRMPNNEIALELIRKSNCPIAAPSANKFGKISPTNAAHVQKNLQKVDFVLDGGKTNVGIESTIIKLNSNGFEILRHGIITQEEIETVIPFAPEENIQADIVAPGMLQSHYSPTKPFYIINDTILNQIDKQKAGFISFSGKNLKNFKEVFHVSQNGDLKEYAVNLFEAMHHFQESDVDYIIAEPVAEKGIGIAIMDRLKKAAFNSQK